MHQIINFLIRNKHFLLFAFLLMLSLVFTIQSHSYHRSKFVNSANWFTGGIYGSVTSVQDYFKLKTYNKQLLEENARLREMLKSPNEDNLDLEVLTDITSPIPSDSLRKFSYIPAKVLNNNYAKTDNFITLLGGSQDSIHKDQGVITSKGIVGIIDKTSSGYSTVLSILNSNFTTSAKLRASEHFGTMQWDGEDPNIVQVIDMQQQAPVKLGDTIETSGKSAIFPKGIPIGTVNEFVLDPSKNFYTLSIKLINDMTNLGHVYVVENSYKKEIIALETQQDEE
ncbi:MULTISPECIES: rod shape-determining protein MreC [unclassified Dokdonia]|jgi:rod shape-determining protein MreC|uniref:rod shape-determining protein MreC n=1 Tax=unclassified Dokdonia TaxID=2615033 RepID=UPI00020A6D9D|nr:rod shape-determining protein MreC [Dokdonia sp. 4H-3-7-5]AEE19635.1 rod shape-determining protein MreC [Dokdonia sp. 4H-3-7-5]|tara:strand:+ start:42491 stop:43336 length:846 start_codon:yes stop_codon:yes gene_type:complete